MKLFFKPEGQAESSNLHELGTIYILGEESQLAPGDLPQTETRIVKVRIEVEKDSYAENRTVIEEIRGIILNRMTGHLKWQDEDRFDDEGVKIADGEVFLEREVEICGHTFPDENSWGVSEQVCTVDFRYVLDRSDKSTHATAWFRNTATELSDEIELGRVTGLEDDFKQSRYMELRNVRERSSGTIQLKGEFLAADCTQPILTRRVSLLDKCAKMKEQVNCQLGHLKFGFKKTGSDYELFFDRDVRVDSFTATVDQASFTIRWSLSASYTAFPDEDGYAAAQFEVRVSEDKESGENVLSLTGTIASATETIASSKLSLVRAAALGAHGFSSTQCVQSEIVPSFINADDTQDTAANSSLDPGNVYITLRFTETYRKRIANILSYTLSIQDSEDTATGLCHRTYSGSVIAGGATADAAYLTAVSKARELGDNKLPFRLNSRLNRVDRQINEAGGAAKEHISLEFSFEYLYRGERIYLEVTTSTQKETFGENRERVSGFVVAKDLTTAQNAYKTQVYALYNGRIIEGEETSSGQNIFEGGTYASTGKWTPDGKFSGIFVRLDFSFSVFKAKDTGEYAIQYGIQVATDFVNLRKSTTIDGAFAGDPTLLAAVTAGTAGNTLDLFLAGFNFGKLISKSRNANYGQVGNSLSYQKAVGFTNNYIDRLSTAAQVLECSVKEDIQYSGVRWNIANIPDGVSICQDCGIQPGSRTVSGTVKAATEDAAMAWVKKQRSLPFYTGTVGGGAAPASRIQNPPQVSKEWDFLPIEDGTARGVGANALCIKASFQFSEVLINYPWTE